MSKSIVQYDVPVVTAGIDLVTVHLFFEIDPETCDVAYQSFSVSGLADLTFDGFGLSTGVSVQVNVIPGTIAVIPCDGGGCRKEVTVAISVTKVFSILGATIRRAPYTVTSIFKTSCKPECCERYPEIIEHEVKPPKKPVKPPPAPPTPPPSKAG